MGVELKQLSLACNSREYELLQHIKDNENGFSNPICGKTYMEYIAWLRQEDDYSRGINMPQGWVPQTTYFLYADGEAVGLGRIRHRTCANLERVGVGNLGYAVSELQRGKGYGYILLAELLKLTPCFGYDKIRLFPLKDNLATVEVMLKNGGEIVGSLGEVKHIVEIPVGKDRA